MTATLAHRGPDDSGIWHSGSVGLGHTRLSILDLSTAGHQPMLHGQTALVYNGEIYNFRALRDELVELGYAFDGGSDTEVVLKSWAAWGVACFRRFEGMFAIAIWDGPTDTLYLARDRFGIKPLFWSQVGGQLVFGSEIKALLASGRVSAGLDARSMHEFLYYGTALGDRTLFGGIMRLLPGSYLAFSSGRVQVDQHWSASSLRTRSDIGTAQAVSTVRELLDEAVRSHLVSDVPVGVFLSGGIDSTAIATFAARHYPGRLSTFSAGFDFGANNELPMARRIAASLGTDHSEIYIRSGDVREVIESLVRCHDQPFSDAANIPLFLMCRQLGGRIKVILQGDGGDEIFAGYRRYAALNSLGWWQVAGRLVGPWLGHLGQGRRRNRLTRFIHAMTRSDAAERMALLLTEESNLRPPTHVLAHDFQSEVVAWDPFTRYRDVFAQLADHQPVQAMLHTDTQIILPDIFLEKVDKSTMAHGIEVRVPMLDNRLTDYVMALPSSMKIRQGHKKWVLRRALRGLVPDEVLDGPKKGFGVPYGEWIRGPLAGYTREVLLDPAVRQWGLFNTDIVKKHLDEHISGDRNHGFLLYKLLNFTLWYDRYLA